MASMLFPPVTRAATADENVRTFVQQERPAPAGTWTPRAETGPVTAPLSRGRTPVAHTLYGLIVVLGGLALQRVRRPSDEQARIQELEARQRDLERMLRERTDELRQRVEELSVINSVQEGLVRELDLQAIYDLVGDRVRDLFDAQVVVIRTFDHEKGSEHLHYVVEKGQRFYLDPVPADAFTRHLMQLREPVLINEDFVGYVGRFDSSSDATVGEVPRSALFVPMIVGDVVRGNVSLQNVDREHAFTESDVRLLTTLANSLSIALENARLFAETRQQAAELDTVNRVSRALVSQLEFEALVRLVGEQMRQTFQADIVYVALYDREHGLLHFPYEHGDTTPTRPFGSGLTERIITTREPLLINRDIDEVRRQLQAQQIGRVAASYLGVPIPAGDEAIGVISVQSTQEENRFDADDLRLLGTIAASVGVALQNAEAYRQLNAALEHLRQAQQQLVHQEKLASLGALTAGIAHEIKNPLNFVNNFAALSRELADEATTARLEGNDEELDAILLDLRTNAAKIEEHGRRADSIVRSMMQHARGGRGARESVDLNALVEEHVNLAYHGKRAVASDFGVTLERDYGADLGSVELVSQDIGRVMLNLLTNAFDAVAERAAREGEQHVGGRFVPRVRIATRRVRDQTEIVIEDNGPGMSESVQARIFEPFFTTKPAGSGTGLGLSMSYDVVVHGHGGTIEVDSEPGRTRFTVTLPAMAAPAAAGAGPILRS